MGRSLLKAQRHNHSNMFELKELLHHKHTHLTTVFMNDFDLCTSGVIYVYILSHCHMRWVFDVVIVLSKIELLLFVSNTTPCLSGCEFHNWSQLIIAFDFCYKNDLGSPQVAFFTVFHSGTAPQCWSVAVAVASCNHRPENHVSLGPSPCRISSIFASTNGLLYKISTFQQNPSKVSKKNNHIKTLLPLMNIEQHHPSVHPFKRYLLGGSSQLVNS